MAAARPISLMNIPDYPERSRKAHRIYAERNAETAAQLARELGIDYIFIGPAEQQAQPGGFTGEIRHSGTTSSSRSSPTPARVSTPFGRDSLAVCVTWPNATAREPHFGHLSTGLRRLKSDKKPSADVADGANSHLLPARQAGDEQLSSRASRQMPRPAARPPAHAVGRRVRNTTASRDKPSGPWFASCQDRRASVQCVTERRRAAACCRSRDGDTSRQGTFRHPCRSAAWFDPSQA